MFSTYEATIHCLNYNGLEQYSVYRFSMSQSSSVRRFPKWSWVVVPFPCFTVVKSFLNWYAFLLSLFFIFFFQTHYTLLPSSFLLPFLCTAWYFVSYSVVWVQSTTNDYIRAEHKLHSITKLFISQFIIPEVFMHAWIPTFMHASTAVFVCLIKVW